MVSTVDKLIGGQVTQRSHKLSVKQVRKTIFCDVGINLGTQWDTDKIDKLLVCMVFKVVKGGDKMILRLVFGCSGLLDEGKFVSLPDDKMMSWTRKFSHL